MWDALLKGREVHIVRTSDAPSLYAWARYRDCDLTCVKRAVLGFCGIRTKSIARVRGMV